MATSSDPSLCVVVVARNAAATIGDTLQALKRQRKSALEILLIDDASTDATAKIMAGFAEGSEKARIYRNHENLGPGASRNFAIDHADTEFIAFIDADDWVAPHYYKTLTDAAATFGAPFIKCGHTLVEGVRRSPRSAPSPIHDRPAASRYAFEPMYRSTMVDFPWSWSGVYRLSFLRNTGIRFDGNLFTAEDRLMTWRLHRAVDEYIVIRECGYFYRRDMKDSLTRISDKRQLDVFSALESIAQELETGAAPRYQWVKAFRQAFAMSEFQFNKRDRLDPETRAALPKIIESTLNNFDSSVMDLATADLTMERKALLNAMRTGQLTLADE